MSGHLLQRRLTGNFLALTDYHFAPTEQARENLLAEDVPDKQIVVTGNTVIDSLFSVLEEARLCSFSDELLKQLPFFQKISFHVLYW